MKNVPYKSSFFVTFLFTNTIHSLQVKECLGDTACEEAVGYGHIPHYSSKSISDYGNCFNPARNSSPEVNAESIQITNFKSKSSWFGAFIEDMHGAALSPLFIAHGDLSCTEYLLSRVDKDNRLALELKHYSSDQVDYRFHFNRTGWIEYNERYGCNKESLQVNNTRILDTDYENYIIVFGCTDNVNLDIHKSGLLLLVSSKKDISELLWKTLQKKFLALQIYDTGFSHSLPDITSLLQDRETVCKNYSVLRNQNVLCPKKILRSLLALQRAVIYDFWRDKKAELIKKNADKKISDKKFQEMQDIHVVEITLLVGMFISIALSLYWSHFSF